MSPAGTGGLRAAAHAASRYLCVGLGSLLGGLCRWTLSEAMLAQFGTALPWGTLLVNVAGSLLIGFYATLTEPDGRVYAGPRQRLFVMAGFCGGFTTFSIFSLEMLHHLQRGEFDRAGLYLGISVPAWLLAVWLGHRAAVRLNRLGG